MRVCGTCVRSSRKIHTTRKNSHMSIYVCIVHREEVCRRMGNHLDGLCI